MWTLEYSNEAKFYFIDNGDYVFDLLVKIEELKFFPDAMPPEGCTPLDDKPNTYKWAVSRALGYL